MAKRSREKCEGRGEGDGQRAARERRGDDGGSEEVTAGGREDGDTLKIIETENGDLESEVLTKAQKKELKKLKNLEWKWHRGENDPNPRHTEYYRQQLPELQEEWALFQETMAKDLPVTFRLCTERNRLASSILKSRLLTEFRQLRGRFTVVKEEVVKEVVTPVNWFPDAWQINCDSTTLAKDEAFSPLHSLLTREIRSCHLVRQELVSMIPAILLDPQSCHFTLDMCAAPGSKTEQLISRVCVSSAGEITNGLVVANDADPKRLATLRRRYEACRYPNLVFTCAKADTLQEVLGSKCSFERVLCDVPCTGDGTFRKSPHLWRLFRPRFAAELHPLQLDIARRGVELMKKSHSEGRNCRLVYSTCSLNPIEDEAVVAALLMECWCAGLNLQLLDPSAMVCEDSTVSLLARHLPGIRWRPGVSEWSSDSEIMLAGEKDATEREESRARLPPLSRSMMCPQSQVMRRELSLQRCMRMLPQDMNTGGFFIAVLEISSKPVTDDQIEALRSEDLLPRELENKRKGSQQLQLTSEKKLRTMKTFQALGYNPHPTPEVHHPQSSSRKNIAVEWREKSEAFTYCPLRPEDIDLILRNLGCSLPFSPPFHLLLEEAPPPTPDPVKKQKRSSSTTQSPSYHLSILSPSAMRLIELNNVASPFIAQAGVRVADLPSKNTTKRILSEELLPTLNRFGGSWAITLLGGRSLEISCVIFKNLLARELSLSTQEEGDVGDLEQLQSLPWNSYALLSTSIILPSEESHSTTNTTASSSGKRRMSKAERKRSKVAAVVETSQKPCGGGFFAASLEHPPLVSTLSVVVRKVMGGGELAHYELKTSRETVESYYECLHRFSSS